MTKSKPYFALTSPLTRLLDKPSEQFTRRDLMRVIAEQQIERIGFHYTALDGKLKELKIPLGSPRQAEVILAEGERVDGSSLFKGMVDAAVSDLYVVPLYRSAFLNPFVPGSLDFVCRYFTKDGQMAPFAPDTILAKASSLLERTTGLSLHTLGELEFFLIGDNHNPIYPARRQQAYHSSAPYVKGGQFLDEMIHTITQICGHVKYAHSEVGTIEGIRSDLPELKGKCGEQMEIEFLPRPVEESGDSLVLGRWLIRDIAFRHQCVATFAPKLEEGIAGNGLHIHMALMRDGKNVMTDGHGELTAEARRLIGGLCHYADSLTAFGNTVSSAYLRLVPNQEAPTRICWSDLNRSTMIRVPLGWSKVNTHLARMLNPQEQEEFAREESRQTIELRSPDGSAMAHLLLAGMTMAAQWGLTQPQALELAERYYVTGNIFKEKALLDSLPALPGSCVASSRLLKEKRALYERDEVFPQSVVDYTARLLAREDDETMNQRLVDLPADDRLHETRKIMHRCLHEQ